MGIGFVEDEEDNGKNAEDNDSVLEDESVSDGHELSGKVAISGDKSAEARKIGKGGVGGEEEDSCGHDHDGVGERSSGELFEGKLGEDSLVAGFADVFGHDSGVPC